MKIKNILWDWNGTLINDAYLFVDIMNTTLAQHGLPLITLQKYKNNFCFPVQTFWKGLGFKFNKNQFQKMNAEFIALYQSKMKEANLQRGALQVLSFAKKNSIKQFILSASEHKILNELAVSYKIEGYFSDIVGVDNLNASGKVELAQSLIQKHGMNPKETVVIGDTFYDADVAQSIGSGLILVACGHFKKQRLLGKNVVVVDSLVDLLPFLL